MGKQRGAQQDGKGKQTATSKVEGEKEVHLPYVGGKKQPRRLESKEEIVADQIVLCANTLTNEECDSLITLFDGDRATLTMQSSPPAKKGEAERTNFRFSTVSPTFAKQLYEQTGLAALVASWPSMFPRSGARPIGLSSNIRIYRYDPGALFACHYDDHSVDPYYGAAWGKTEWTLLVYLTGEPDVQGGQTVFYKSHTRPKEGVRSENAVVVPLRKGAALLHRHGKVSDE